MTTNTKQCGLLGALVVALLLGWAGPARGDELARAKELFQQAEGQFNLGNFEGALKLYQRAYRHKPLAGFHFNIGQCFRNLGRHEQAIHHFSEYLDKSKHAGHKAQARRLIKLSRQSLARQRSGSKDGENPLEPGAPAGEPKDGVAGGEPAATPPPAPSEPVVAATPAPASGRRKLRPLYFWGTAGLTGTFLLVGTITGAMALGKSSDYNDPATRFGELADLKSSGETLRDTSSAMFTLGIVGAAATATLFFFTDFGSTERQVAVTPLPGGAMVAAGGWF